MGIVIAFPETRRAPDACQLGTPAEAATVIILPVVRVERYAQESPEWFSEDPTPPPGRKRRRPSRS
jgi:hypothetical protein